MALPIDPRKPKGVVGMVDETIDNIRRKRQLKKAEQESLLAEQKVQEESSVDIDEAVDQPESEIRTTYRIQAVTEELNDCWENLNFLFAEFENSLQASLSGGYTLTDKSIETLKQINRFMFELKKLEEKFVDAVNKSKGLTDEEKTTRINQLKDFMSGINETNNSIVSESKGLLVDYVKNAKYTNNSEEVQMNVKYRNDLADEYEQANIAFNNKLTALKQKMAQAKARGNKSEIDRTFSEIVDLIEQHRLLAENYQTSITIAEQGTSALSDAFKLLDTYGTATEEDNQIVQDSRKKYEEFLEKNSAFDAKNEDRKKLRELDNSARQVTSSTHASVVNSNSKFNSLETKIIGIEQSIVSRLEGLEDIESGKNAKGNKKVVEKELLKDRQKLLKLYKEIISYLDGLRTNEFEQLGDYTFIADQLKKYRSKQNQIEVDLGLKSAEQKTAEDVITANTVDVSGTFGDKVKRNLERLADRLRPKEEPNRRYVSEMRYKDGTLVGGEPTMGVAQGRVRADGPRYLNDEVPTRRKPITIKPQSGPANNPHRILNDGVYAGRERTAGPRYLDAEPTSQVRETETIHVTPTTVRSKRDGRGELVNGDSETLLQRQNMVDQMVSLGLKRDDAVLLANNLSDDDIRLTAHQNAEIRDNNQNVNSRLESLRRDSDEIVGERGFTISSLINNYTARTGKTIKANKNVDSDTIIDINPELEYSRSLRYGLRMSLEMAGMDANTADQVTTSLSIDQVTKLVQPTNTTYMSVRNIVAHANQNRPESDQIALEDNVNQDARIVCEPVTREGSTEIIDWQRGVAVPDNNGVLARDERGVPVYKTVSEYIREQSYGEATKGRRKKIENADETREVVAEGPSRQKLKEILNYYTEGKLPETDLNRVVSKVQTSDLIRLIRPASWTSISEIFQSAGEPVSEEIDDVSYSIRSSNEGEHYVASVTKRNETTGDIVSEGFKNDEEIVEPKPLHEAEIPTGIPVYKAKARSKSTTSSSKPVSRSSVSEEPTAETSEATLDTEASRTSAGIGAGTLRGKRRTTTSPTSEKKYSDDELAKLTAEQLAKLSGSLRAKANKKLQEGKDKTQDVDKVNARIDEIGVELTELSVLARPDTKTSKAIEVNGADVESLKILYALGLSKKHIDFLLRESKVKVAEVVKKNGSVSSEELVEELNAVIDKYNYERGLAEGEDGHFDLIDIDDSFNQFSLKYTRSGLQVIVDGAEDSIMSVNDYFAVEGEKRAQQILNERENLESSLVDSEKADAAADRAQNRVKAVRQAIQAKALNRDVKPDTKEFDKLVADLRGDNDTQRNNLINFKTMPARFTLIADIVSFANAQKAGLKNAILESDKPEVVQELVQMLVAQIDAGKIDASILSNDYKFLGHVINCIINGNEAQKGLATELIEGITADRRKISELNAEEASGEDKSEFVKLNNLDTIRDFYERKDGVQFSIGELLEGMKQPTLVENSEEAESKYDYEVSIDKFKWVLLNREVPRCINREDRYLQEVYAKGGDGRRPDFEVYYSDVENLFNNAKDYYNKYHNDPNFYDRTRRNLYNIDNSDLDDKFYIELAKTMSKNMWYIIQHVQQGRLMGTDSMTIAQCQLWLSSGSQKFINAFIPQLEMLGLDSKVILKLGASTESHKAGVERVDNLTTVGARANINKQFGVVFDNVVARNKGVSLFSLDNKRVKDYNVELAPCNKTDNQEVIFNDLKNGIVDLTSDHSELPESEKQQLALKGIKSILQAREYLKGMEWSDKFIQNMLSKFVSVNDDGTIAVKEPNYLVADDSKNKNAEENAINQICSIVGGLLTDENGVINQVAVETILSNEFLTRLTNGKEVDVNELKNALLGKLTTWNSEYVAKQETYNKKYGEKNMDATRKGVVASKRRLKVDELEEVPVEEELTEEEEMAIDEASEELSERAVPEYRDGFEEDADRPVTPGTIPPPPSGDGRRTPGAGARR